MYLAVLASMIHGLTVPGSIEVAQRNKGLTNGMWEWLRKAPWDNPVFSGMFISLLVFGFIGGITGVVMGTEQINLIIHNTIYVPAHFHATVAVGTTLAFMALTYLLIPVLFRREMILPQLARLQPYIFGGGMTILILFMLGAGTLGVSRRHWDMDFTGAAIGFEYPGMAYTLMAIAAIGGLLAIVGGGIYLLVTVGSLLFGKKLEPSAGILESFLGQAACRLCLQHDSSGNAAHGAEAQCGGTWVGRIRGTGHLRSGHVVAGLVRNLLFHQLEISGVRLAAGLSHNTGAGRFSDPSRFSS